MRSARRETRGGDDTISSEARDSGFSVVEIVVTIAIMSILIAPMMTAVVAGVRASTNTSNLAKVETALQNAADRINRAPKECDYGRYVRAAAQSVGWPPGQAAVTSPEVYKPAASPTVRGTWGACEGQLQVLDVQLLTITVTSPDGRVVRHLKMVKSNV